MATTCSSRKSTRASTCSITSISCHSHSRRGSRRHSLPVDVVSPPILGPYTSTHSHSPWHRSSSASTPTQSRWDEGLAAIASLLQEDSNVYCAMTKEQRQGLRLVRNLLLSFGTSSSNDLLALSFDSSDYSGLDEDGSKNKKHASNSSSNSNSSSRVSSTARTMHIPTQLLRHANNQHCAASQFLMKEFGGASPTTKTLTSSSPRQRKCKKEVVQKRVQSLLTANKFVKHLAWRSSVSKEAKKRQTMLQQLDQAGAFVPPEFTQMSKQHQLELYRMLSWQSLATWGANANVNAMDSDDSDDSSHDGSHDGSDNSTAPSDQTTTNDASYFDIFRLNELTNGNPLLFVGWAILGAPYAQHAMKKAIFSDEEEETSSEFFTVDQQEQDTDQNAQFQYNFIQEYQIPPLILCNFLRSVQAEYEDQNPYHNMMHAADVVQTAHTIVHNTLACGLLSLNEDRLSIFSILVAAVVHDMGHPGYNNSYQVNARTDLAITYNDISVLENMHVSKAFAMLFQEHKSNDCGTSNSTSNNNNKSTATKQASGNKKDQPEANVLSSVNILCGMDDAQISAVRRSIIQGVLSTDMSKHFQSVNEMKGVLVRWQQVQQQQQQQQSDDMNDIYEENSSAADTSQDDGEGSNNSSSDDNPRSSCQGSDASSIGNDGNVDRMKDPDMIQKLLNYILHVADISNPAKPQPLAVQWTDCCLQELFQQGDLEAANGLTKSPLCDRSSTSKSKSQIGFLQFVVEPAYHVLCAFVPTLHRTIAPILDENLTYWQEQWEIEEEQQQQQQQQENDSSVRKTTATRSESQSSGTEATMPVDLSDGEE